MNGSAPVIRHREKNKNATDRRLVRLDAVEKVFYADEVETRALSGIHLAIREGEYVSIAGPSGCGKSTLLSILWLLKPTEASLTNDQDGDTRAAFHLPELLFFRIYLVLC